MNDDRNSKTTKEEIQAKSIVLVDATPLSDGRNVVGAELSDVSDVLVAEPIHDPQPLEAEMEAQRKAEKKATIKAEKQKKREQEEERETEAIKAVIAEHAREDEQPLSPNITLKKILGGDILSAQLFRTNIKLIILIVGFVIVYISNRYSVQKDLIEIDRLNTELEDAKYRALSSSSQLTEKSRESHILELLKSNKDSVLKIAAQPPYIIKVPEK